MVPSNFTYYSRGDVSPRLISSVSANDSDGHLTLAQARIEACAPTSTPLGRYGRIRTPGA